jgi:predicted dienelactone hydrolase
VNTIIFHPVQYLFTHIPFLCNTKTNPMKKITLTFSFALTALISFGQFAIGSRTITYNDPTRTGGTGSGGGPGRQIECAVYYPATTAGTNTPVADGVFPVVVFGHGFAMAWSAYQNVWEHLTPKGYIMIFPKTESGIFPTPSHNDFGLDLVVASNRILASNEESSSPFFQKVSGKIGIMGHSMGGGATILAAENNENIKTIIGLAPAETNPSAIDATGNVFVPALILSGSSDGVTPPSDHHIPIYQGLISQCKSFVSINGGAHCYFANTNAACDFGESTSSTAISITRLQQQMATFAVLDPWLDYMLKDICASYEAFEFNLTNTQGIIGQTTCPSNPTIDVSQNGSILGTSTIGTSYQWFLNGQPISGATSNEYNMGQNTGGVYYVEVAFPFGCGVSPNLTVLGLNNPLVEFITVNPNPAIDFISIKNNSSGIINATLLSLNGVKLIESSFIEKERIMDLSPFSPGIYLLQFEQSGFVRTDKIIIP